MERIEEVIECTRQGRKDEGRCVCVCQRREKKPTRNTYIYIEYICTWQGGIYMYVYGPPPRSTATKGI